jgi:hypothetical protein
LCAWSASARRPLASKPEKLTMAGGATRWRGVLHEIEEIWPIRDKS